MEHARAAALRAGRIFVICTRISRILAALKRAGADASTLVVFTSDNGGERSSDTCQAFVAA